MRVRNNRVSLYLQFSSYNILFLLQEEISALEKKLSELRGRRDVLVAAVATEDEKIAQVQSDMAEERRRLDDQRHTIQEQQDRLDAEQVCGMGGSSG